MRFIALNVSEFYAGRDRDFYISLKEIEKNPRMQRMMYEIEEERFLLLISILSPWKWQNIKKETSDYIFFPEFKKKHHWRLPRFFTKTRFFLARFRNKKKEKNKIQFRRDILQKFLDISNIQRLDLRETYLSLLA